MGEAGLNSFRARPLISQSPIRPFTHPFRARLQWAENCRKDCHWLDEGFHPNFSQLLIEKKTFDSRHFLGRRGDVDLGLVTRGANGREQEGRQSFAPFR